MFRARPRQRPRGKDRAQSAQETWAPDLDLPQGRKASPRMRGRAETQKMDRSAQARKAGEAGEAQISRAF